jgi:hypothetical protein
MPADLATALAESSTRIRISSGGSDLAEVDPEKIYRYLVGKHQVSDSVARGILANIQAESNFNTSAVGDGGTSGGLFQHHAGRWDNLKNFAKSTERSWDDWTAQVDFAIKEAKGMGITLQMSDAVEASKVWTLKFERPANAQVKAKQRAKNVNKYKFGGPPSIQRSQTSIEEDDTMFPLHFTDGFNEPKEQGRTRKRDDVKVLQAMLGFSHVDIDGRYGDETVRKVKAIVGGNGKTVDGMAYIKIQEEYLRSFLRSSDNG